MDYWTVSHSEASRFGFFCRECHKYINKGDHIAIRDGRKIRLIYHEDCFNGKEDPRTQSGSSFNQGRLPNKCFQSRAPTSKY